MRVGWGGSSTRSRELRRGLVPQRTVGTLFIVSDPPGSPHPPTSDYPFAGCTTAEPASVLPDSDRIPNQRLRQCRRSQFHPNPAPTTSGEAQNSHKPGSNFVGISKPHATFPKESQKDFSVKLMRHFRVFVLECGRSQNPG